MAQQELLPIALDTSLAKTVSDAFTKPLRDCLLAGTAKETASEIAASATMIAECRQIAPTVERLARSAGPDGVAFALQPAILEYGAPKFSDDSTVSETLTGHWLHSYQRLLGKYPKEALEQAVDLAMLNGKFFPRINELEKYAKPIAEKAWKLAWGVKQAIEYADKHRAVIEDPEARAAMLAEIASWKRSGGFALQGFKPAVRPASSQHAMADSLRASAGA